jgi:hypothetical protein
MEKKFPIIHSAMTVRMRSTGPTKKKMPLEDNQYHTVGSRKVVFFFGWI